MKIALSQLQQVVEGSGGTVGPIPGMPGYQLKFPSGLIMYGALVELSQLGMDSEHVQVWSGRIVYVKDEAVQA